jgi:hypothetical protein
LNWLETKGKQEEEQMLAPQEKRGWLGVQHSVLPRHPRGRCTGKKKREIVMGKV